ncbi:PREDICTED: synaptotagmin-11-like [Priapulus caudatus]|uniref:Synaptotagmin-11-like n=1 Tax=Priapulus caudatus TaxID=37621 RepID=A0ABM1DQJ0_PRICU|nr:PREDICTED: synaptotagmin-11-like [Priapulus caudatus]
MAAVVYLSYTACSGASWTARILARKTTRCRGSLMTSPSGVKTVHVVAKKTPSPTKPHRDFGGSEKKSPRSADTSPADVTDLKRMVHCHIENEKEGRVLSPGGGPLQASDGDKSLKSAGNGLGELNFVVKYNFEKTALLVSILKASNLPAKDANMGSSDPYIKLQLLPERQHRVKTRVLRKTLDPVYNEEFTFYGLNYNQLYGVMLHFVVLSFDRYSRDDVIGEVIFPLKDVDLKEKEVTVFREISPRNLKVRDLLRRSHTIPKCFKPQALKVGVAISRNLGCKIFSVISLDPYVKIYMLYNGQRIAKKKTHVKKRTLNPVFNESFLFDVPATEGLQNISLEFLILDWDRVTKNEVIGRLVIGPKSTGNALRHWNEICNSPRRQIAEWHRLKE